jgi:hypothetical protein
MELGQAGKTEIVACSWLAEFVTHILKAGKSYAIVYDSKRYYSVFYTITRCYIRLTSYSVLNDCIIAFQHRIFGQPYTYHVLFSVRRSIEIAETGNFVSILQLCVARVNTRAPVIPVQLSVYLHLLIYAWIPRRCRTQCPWPRLKLPEQLIICGWSPFGTFSLGNEHFGNESSGL